MNALPRFAEVAVTLPVAGRFHYRVPEHLVARAQLGARVLVRFGKSKVTGVVVRTDTQPPAGVTALDLSEVLDEDQPALPPDLVELCLWVAEYYEAPPGEVMRAALPAGSGVGARAVIGLTDAGRAVEEGGGAALPAKQRAMIAKLAAGAIPATGSPGRRVRSWRPCSRRGSRRSAITERTRARSCAASGSRASSSTSRSHARRSRARRSGSR